MTCLPLCSYDGFMGSTIIRASMMVSDFVCGGRGNLHHIIDAGTKAANYSDIYMKAKWQLRGVTAPQAYPRSSINRV